MRARFWAYLLGAAAAAYMAFALWQAWAFLTSGSIAGALLGLAVLPLPLLGLWLVWRELSFASRVQRLAAQLEAEDRLPPELPRRPSGRVQPEAAVAEFDRCAAEVRNDPRDPASWYALAMAYEAGRDRKRARLAMRYAVALADGQAPPEAPRLFEE